jgi:hypothetical protein
MLPYFKDKPPIPTKKHLANYTSNHISSVVRATKVDYEPSKKTYDKPVSKDQDRNLKYQLLLNGS